ncbi:MAG: serine hydroxymethyltransferase [Candidatus Micrarchaeota archaeon]|nr:serine hydroxymethyltransferase [Candidatus Micrarchaeota archaeon]
MGTLRNLKRDDPEVYKSIKDELKRQRDSLEMIPSENFASINVISALGTVLNNKYSEGYPKRRYYGGNEFIDNIESIAIERAKALFGVPHVNVQPYSGSPANFAVYAALCKPGDTIMGLNLTDGGHLTHGWKTSVTGEFFKSVPYHVKADGYIDIDEARKLAMESRPKLIWIGATAYARELPFKEFGEIADSSGAYLAADISHIAGLVAGKVHGSPVEYAHVITSTTHKTLRGPRGAMIMITGKGLSKDPELANKIDRTVFPGLQGGPHDNVTAALAVALLEASRPEFKEYASQIVKNSRALADGLMGSGLSLVTGGTDNHMMLIDLTPFGKGKGIFGQEALNAAGIVVNKNTIPNEQSSPFYPSGIRLGTPAITSRGMKEEQMMAIAGLIADTIKKVKDYSLPEDKEARRKYMEAFHKKVKSDKGIRQTRVKVRELCDAFPLYKGLKL